MLIAAVSLIAVAACRDGGKDGETPSAFESPGPYPVGNATFLVTDSASGRVLLTEVWYPAAESARAAADAGAPIEEFVPAGANRDAFVALLPAAADPGTRRRTSSARDAIPATGGPWPVAAFSHCHGCLRFSSFTVAERLASHGVVVLAPDHPDGDLFARLGGTLSGITPEFLAVRGGDMSAMISLVLTSAGTLLPAGLALDPDRIGAFGHSYGAATTGYLLHEDSRIKAGAALAAPMSNPLFPAVTMAGIAEPTFLLVAREDNSITETGNDFIRLNFADAAAPSAIAEVADAGHWSFSDLCGITPAYEAGCVEGATRQTNGEPFTYLDVTAGRQIAASYVTAFFAARLQNDPTGAAYLESGHPRPTVTTQTK